MNADASILHFAPEEIFEKIFREHYRSYCTADLFEKADLSLNIEDIKVDNKKFDIIIANHVLEHVDDRRASYEISRILTSEGIFVCQVPIIEGWHCTYENDLVKSSRERLLHFGQGDHVRFYGADFRKRICEGGLRLVKEYTSEGEDVIRYGLLRGEKVFIFKKALI